MAGGAVSKPACTRCASSCAPLAFPTAQVSAMAENNFGFQSVFARASPRFIPEAEVVSANGARNESFPQSRVCSFGMNWHLNPRLPNCAITPPSRGSPLEARLRSTNGERDVYKRQNLNNEELSQVEADASAALLHTETEESFAKDLVQQYTKVLGEK